jgi:sugar diacid utilization regulator
VTSFGVVAPLALMAVSINLVRKWVIEMLGTLADDDDHNARLRGTLAAFLQENGSYRAAAERLTLHKNTVQYRIRKPKRASAVPSARTACISSWLCWPASGWARQSRGRRVPPAMTARQQA